MAVSFQTVTGYALDTRYGTDDLFDNGITRLATILIFSENLEKARVVRLKKASKDVPQIAATFGLINLENVTTTDHLERISGISNLKHTVQDIHDILKAYYTVARKRFVDNVCMQATDYHLVSGPEMPLKVFSPTFVGNLTSDQLEAIAEDDGTSIKRRREFHKQMESLARWSKSFSNLLARV
ncbi:unnamed protein product [Alternaria alternata]